MLWYEECPTGNTPLAFHFRLSTSLLPKTKEEKDEMSRVSYSNAVDSLIYAMVLPRQDISQSVSVVSKYKAHSSKAHWQAMK